MGKLESGYARHTQGLGDKITLGPKRFSDQRYRWYASPSQINAVTHGAGSAGASVTVGRDDSDALPINLTEQFFTGWNGGVTFVVCTQGQPGPQFL